MSADRPTRAAHRGPHRHLRGASGAGDRLLTSAQDERIRTLERGRPWWRKALGATCESLTVGTGAGGGEAIGGPVGAAIGGVVGYAGGALACR